MIWKDHLANVKKHNPDKSLKECMQIASASYKGTHNTSNHGKSKASMNEKALVSSAKDSFADIIGYSKDLKTVVR